MTTRTGILKLVPRWWVLIILRLISIDKELYSRLMMIKTRPSFIKQLRADYRQVWLKRILFYNKDKEFSLSKCQFKKLKATLASISTPRLIFWQYLSEWVLTTSLNDRLNSTNKFFVDWIRHQSCEYVTMSQIF